MSEKVLFDIPTSHKKYHNIRYDAETNQYHMAGHKTDDWVEYLGISIPSNAKITHDTNVPDVIDIRMGNVILQLYPLSVMIYHWND